jgi:hypothetical protein
VVSKKQAQAVGDALAQESHSRTQPRPFGMRLDPELEKIPARDRDIRTPAGDV